MSCQKGSVDGQCFHQVKSTRFHRDNGYILSGLSSMFFSENLYLILLKLPISKYTIVLFWNEAKFHLKHLVALL